MPILTIAHLDEEHLLDAWPILHVAGGEVQRLWWENEARALLGRGGGILAARAADGTVYGVATYECAHRDAESVLAVDRLVALELNGNEPVKRALRGAIDEIASAFGCSAIALPARPSPVKWPYSSFCFRGFAASAMARSILLTERGRPSASTRRR